MKGRFILVLLLLVCVSAFADETISPSGTTAWTPKHIYIVPGESVLWNFTTLHTSTSTIAEDSCTQSAGPDAWDASSGPFSKTFNNVGNFYYMCTPHCMNGMTGTVHVIDFNISCDVTTVDADQNGSGDTTCTITSLNGLTLPVDIDVTGLPSGVTMGYSADPVNPPANSTANSVVTFNVDNTVPDGNYPVTIEATATSASTTPGVRTKQFNVTLRVGNAPLFSDSFSTTDLSGWTLTKPPNWTAPSGSLIGTTTTSATAFPNSYTMCADCQVEGYMSIAPPSGTTAFISLYGWYVDKKNYVELLMKRDIGKWILKHKSNGTVVAKGKAIQPIVPNTTYHAVIDYNGTALTLSLDGVVVINNLVSPPPQATGKPGFKVKATTGTFDSIECYQ